jgi:hypothetical protein
LREDITFLIAHGTSMRDFSWVRDAIAMEVGMNMAAVGKMVCFV